MTWVEACLPNCPVGGRGSVSPAWGVQSASTECLFMSGLLPPEATSAQAITEGSRWEECTVHSAEFGAMAGHSGGPCWPSGLWGGAGRRAQG